MDAGSEISIWLNSVDRKSGYCGGGEGSRASCYAQSLPFFNARGVLSTCRAATGTSPSDHHRRPFRSAVDVSDGGVLFEALYVRREMASDFLKKALTEARFSIKYSADVVSALPGFIDRIVLTAASLRHSPHFSRSSYNARVRAAIDESGLVQLVRWMKGHSLPYPLIGDLVCSSEGDLDAVRGRVEWLLSVGVQPKFLRLVLARVGVAILHRTVAELEETVSYLKSKGMGRSDWISRAPQLLACGRREIEARVDFYYVGLGMDAGLFSRMVDRCPKAIGAVTSEEMNRKAVYLRELGLTDDDIARAVSRAPLLMTRDAERCLIPAVTFLYYLCLGRDDIRSILVANPLAFCLEPDEVIAPKARLLRHLGVEGSRVGRVFVKFPQFLTSRFRGKSRRMVSRFRGKSRRMVELLVVKAGVDREDIGRVVYSDPKLLGASMEKVDGHVKYFLSLGISRSQLGEMITRFPTLLRCSAALLRAKYRYLRDTMIRPVDDIVAFPRYFSYCLEGRIVRRHNVLVTKRLHLTLQCMLACADREFDRRVEAAQCLPSKCLSPDRDAPL